MPELLPGPHCARTRYVQQEVIPVIACAPARNVLGNSARVLSPIGKEHGDLKASERTLDVRRWVLRFPELGDIQI